MHAVTNVVDNGSSVLLRADRAGLGWQDVATFDGIDADLFHQKINNGTIFHVVQNGVGAGDGLAPVAAEPVSDPGLDMLA